MSLTQKYRPKTLDDVVGQPKTVISLKTAIAKNKIHNAYLFAGSRGTGKTSVARVLAKSLNCANGQTVTPCGECHSCKAIESGNAIDVFEVDAASNNGVDYARDLIKGASLSSMGGRFKIYIIDECHNLTKQASETLLKTVEEPGSKTVFIFCTTEPQKVLKTIESRCQRFNFFQVSPDDIFHHLDRINTEEYLLVQDDVIRAIAQVSDGIVRDAVTLLDQISLNPDATVDDLYAVIGKPSVDATQDILSSVVRGDTLALFANIKSVAKSGVDPLVCLSEIANFVRNGLVGKKDAKAFQLMTCDTNTFCAATKWASKLDEQTLLDAIVLLRKAEIDFSASKRPMLFLESTLIELMMVFQKPILIPPQQPMPDCLEQTAEEIWGMVKTQDCMSKLAPVVVRYSKLNDKVFAIAIPESFRKHKEVAESRLQEALTTAGINMQCSVLFCS
ncbi:hypothetical protein PCC6912_40150 [Chlorogloeopsis fritschii PCC 6912]|uniref:DNA polymerase III subunit gamma/tau n=1 Tax=Chlorogloeopsis fritschii PCC 6912 TaxID=211165 RepID=A0A3S1A121_CHLFR|nr:DNA polymerase III subunit gamma/tau [Chlorogloeopsis fritschii]RUR77056.1 hypothetical protein PCC6912_40150 [Chlorogloeopsis fritschii PCC 6912]